MQTVIDKLEKLKAGTCLICHVMTLIIYILGGGHAGIDVYIHTPTQAYVCSQTLTHGY